MKNYRKTTIHHIRPYVPGEDLIGIAVGHAITPEEGGMIAVSEDSPSDPWYISPEYMAANYEEVV